MSTTSGSRGRGRPPMPLDRIVETAVAVLNEEGADALTMRTLARRLGSGTATLYRHFEGRPQLVAHVVDAVFAQMPSDSDALRAMSWQDALSTAAQDMFEVLRSNPNVAPLMIENPPVGPNALAYRERALSMLLAAGFSPAVAVRAWATVARFVLGFAAQLRGSDPATVQTRAWDGVDPGDFPASVAVAGEVPIPLEEEFRFGLSMLVTGLEQSVRGGLST